MVAGKEEKKKDQESVMIFEANFQQMNCSTKAGKKKGKHKAHLL